MPPYISPCFGFIQYYMQLISYLKNILFTCLISPKMAKSYYAAVAFCLLSVAAQAQPLTIKGKVIDSETGDPVPFANVFVKGTARGTTTDFEGFYTFKIDADETVPDTLTASYLGYTEKSRPVTKNQGILVMNYLLAPGGIQLEEVQVFAGENPAYRIIREAREHASQHDKRNLEAYEYESYSRIEIDVNNVNEKMRKRKLLKKVFEALDSIQFDKGDDGKPIMPVFLSESLSMVYYRDNPDRVSEHVKKMKVRGVGVDDGSLVSQLLGSTYQDFNFYQNYIKFLDKSIPSPFNDSWKLFYEYYLLDSMYIDSDYVYKIDVEPRNKRDLAFTGTIWITKEGAALRQVDLKITEDANINFIEGIRVQQQLQPVAGEDSPWLPNKVRVTVDVAELSENSPGMLIKSYYSNKDFKISKPKPLSFYEQRQVKAEDALETDEEYWNQNRHDSLTEEDKRAYRLVDTIRNIPIVKTYVQIVEIIVQGYAPVHEYFEVGPYIKTIAWNNVEHLRIRLGGRTTKEFSKKVLLQGYGAYGFYDRRMKYNFHSSFVLSRRKWTTLDFKSGYELEQVAFIDSDLEDKPLLSSFVRFWNLDNRGPYMRNSKSLGITREITRGVTPTLTFNRFTFSPLYDFAYYTNDARTETASQFTTSEVELAIRYGKDERFLQNGNRRVSLGHDRFPIVELRYVMGMPNVLGSDFEYHKFFFNVKQKVKLSVLGQGRAIFESGYIPSQLPYPLLKPQFGNELVFLNTLAFNLMNFMEFNTDHFASFRYRQYFQGLLTNSVPFINRYDLRLLATGSVIVGGLREENRQIMAVDELNGTQTFNRGPYAEVSYGVENIFKFIRIEFIHRLTYLDNPGARPFGIKGSLQFKL